MARPLRDFTGTQIPILTPLRYPSTWRLASSSNVKGQTVKAQRKFLLKALGDVTEADAGYLNIKFTVPQSEEYPDVKIDDWLETEAARLGIFDPEAQRWCIPENPTSEYELYEYFIKIFSAILDEFVVPPGTGVEREIMNTHDERFSHVEPKQKTAPDLVVRATGPSFETPSNGAAVGYPNIATAIEVKLDSDLNKTVHLEQMASYIQQMFAHQPNRLYVDAFLLSEKGIRLVHFDRAGAETAPYINLLEKPDMLVRVIIGLCSANEADIGFDTSIKWTIVNGKKKKGTMKTLGPDGLEKTYELVKPHPISQDLNIRGRGHILESNLAKKLQLVCQNSD
ncbi:hypothetical protein NMY22_g19018 [Coprinellus aureogranulatus]|nr:hypothetical protein NMY22_g19018 [Coprinellus aureogranulatus]